MAINVVMNRDISAYEPPIFLSFTKPQLISLLSSFPVGFSCLSFLPFALEARIFLAFLFMTPILLGGFIKIYGMTYFRYVKDYRLPFLFEPQRRICKTTEEGNLLMYLLDTDKAVSKEALRAEEKLSKQEKKELERLHEQYKVMR